MSENSNSIYLKIKRQDAPENISYWNIFLIEYGESDTLLALLLKLADNPKTVDGKETSPVHHEYNCKEEACGTCTVKVNGEPRMSCSTLVKNLPQSSLNSPIVIEPLEKFPVIRDLTVNRNRIFKTQAFIKNWVEVDDFFGPSMAYGRDAQYEMYAYSKCINCGSCYDACPRTDITGHAYMGPAAISQVVKMCSHPLGKENKKDRLMKIMGDNGLSKCGKAQICEKVCPKNVPLVRSIRCANRESVKKLLHLP